MNKIYFKFFDLSFTDSTHIYDIVKFKDRYKEIQENKKAIIKELKAKKIVILHQIHSNDLAIIENGFTDNDILTADASITKEKNIILAIQTADCVPVLLACEDSLIIAAVHCGWRSTKKNIIEKVINRMKKIGAKNIYAIIGPSIQQDSYEVDSKIFKDFLLNNLEYKIFFKPSLKQNHYMFDLPGLVKYQLNKLKVRILKHISENTYSNPKIYPSYRRDIHQNKESVKRILSTIVIR